MKVIIFFILTIAIAFPSYAEEVNQEWKRYSIETKEKKIFDDVRFSYYNLKLKWKLNRIETKYEFHDSLDTRLQFKVDDGLDYRSTWSITFKF